LPCREDAALTPRSRRQKAQPAAPTEWDEKGDGPVLGAHFLVGLLKQHSELRLTYFSATITDAVAFENPSGELCVPWPSPHKTCASHKNPTCILQQPYLQLTDMFAIYSAPQSSRVPRCYMSRTGHCFLTLQMTQQMFRLSHSPPPFPTPLSPDPALDCPKILHNSRRPAELQLCIAIEIPIIAEIPS